MQNLLGLIKANDRLYRTLIAANRTEWLLTAQCMREAMAASVNVQTQAVIKAEVANEKRFDSVNEFRSTLSDQQRLLIPRAEVEVIIRALSDKIDRNVDGLRDLNNRVAMLQAESGGERHGMQSGWGYAAGVVGMIVAAVTIVISLVLRKGP